MFSSGISDSRAKNLVSNCHNNDNCFIWSNEGQESAFLMEKKFVDRISCKSEGTLNVIRHEEYDYGEFYRIDCRSGSTLISKATVWNAFGAGMSIDLAPCELGICTFPQPI
jgi:hypothetical protein